MVPSLNRIHFENASFSPGVSSPVPLCVRPETYPEESLRKSNRGRCPQTPTRALPWTRQRADGPLDSPIVPAPVQHKRMLVTIKMWDVLGGVRGRSPRVEPDAYAPDSRQGSALHPPEGRWSSGLPNYLFQTGCGLTPSMPQRSDGHGMASQGGPPRHRSYGPGRRPSQSQRGLSP
jgi:hypothetical protein